MNIHPVSLEGRMKLVLRLAASLLVFSFLASPVAVFAQEAGGGEVASETVASEETSSAEDASSAEEGSVSAEESASIKKSKEIGTDPETMSSSSSMMIGGENPQTILKESRDMEVAVDENTGALVYSYPLRLPPGRNGLTPDLSLVYNSQDLEDGSPFGYGWDISIPFIERVNKHGTTELYAGNYNDYRSSSDGELVHMSGGSYGPKSENGSFKTYSLSGNVWTVTDKEGTVYTFGGTAASRQDNAADTSQVYRWMLSSVEDTDGNRIEYAYFKDAGQIYPATVSYADDGSSSFAYSVVFSRTVTDPRLSFDAGFSVSNEYVISSIKTYYQTTNLTEYTLAYASQSVTRPFDLLASVTEAGKSPTVTTPLQTTFQYSDTDDAEFVESTTYELTDAMTFDSSGNPYNTTFVVIDYNGDGLPDITVCGPSSNPQQCDSKLYFKNTGTQWVADTTTTFSDGELPDIAYRHQAYGPILDLDGDGLEDVLVMRQTTSEISKFYRNTGNGWAYDSNVSIPNDMIFAGVTGENTIPNWRVGDLNGDRIADFILAGERQYISLGAPPHGDCYSNDWDCRTEWKVYLSDGLSWTESTTDFSAKMDISFSEYDHVGPRDIILNLNGDSLPDALRDLYYHLDNGYGWEDIETTNFQYKGSLGDPATIIADVNGDGYPDMLQAKKDSNGVYQRSTLLNQHDVTAAASSEGPTFDNVTLWYVKDAWVWQYPEIKPFRVMDVNGDGLQDLIEFTRASTISSGIVYTRHVWINEGDVPGLLTKITVPTGGTADISYKTSAQYKDGSGNLLNPDLQFPVRTVSSIVTTDPVSSVASTVAYSYEEGSYYYGDVFDRRFAGFGKVVTIDPAGSVTKTYFHQGNSTNSAQGEYDDHVSKIGKPYLVEKYDSAGNLYSRQVTKWDKSNLGTGRDFVFMAQQVDMAHDGNAGHKDAAARYYYDTTYGNLIQKQEWSEVVASADGTFSDVTATGLRKTDISYAANVPDYVVGLPSQVTVTDQQQNKISEIRYYYDNLSLGSAGAGNQTKEERWTDGTTYVDTQRTYNAFGLPATSTDERGKVTAYTYDAWNLYPVTVTNPLLQDTDYTYDYATGKVVDTTDDNGSIWTTLYDGLGRVIEEKIPSSAGGQVTKSTYAYTDTSGAFSVHKTDWLDASASVDSYVYYDGLGRKIQTRTEGESGDYAVTDTAYDARGNVEKESLPYWSSGTAKTSPTATAALYTTYSYDPLGRVTGISNAAGTSANVYDDWKTTTTDAMGKVKGYYRNGYGNLTAVEENESGITYVTQYEYDGNDKLAGITDAMGNVRTFAYDGLGRRLSATDLHAPGDPDYGTWTYSYDPAGNLSSYTDPNGVTVTYAYDDLNRVTAEDDTSTPGNDITYAYDACQNGIGRLCTAIDPDVTTDYAYAPDGQTASETRTIGANAYLTQMTYDRQGNILDLTYPDTSIVRYAYNTAGQAETVSKQEAGAGVFASVLDDVDYAPTGAISYMLFANGAETTNTYDAGNLYRLQSKVTLSAGTPIQDLAYTYDAVGNITQIDDTSLTPSAMTTAYTYDDLHRLTSATATGSSSGYNYSRSYSYDILGNILSKTGTGAYLYQGTMPGSFANPHAATDIGGVAVAYDSNGNVTSAGPDAYSWNYRNELTQAVVGGTTTDYSYDHSGRRVSLSSGGTATEFPNRYYNTDGSVETRHLFLGSMAVMAVVKDAGLTVPYFLHLDHLGGTALATTAAGTIDQQLAYYPYGEEVFNVQNSSFGERRTWIGEEYDPSSGLHYLNARYYDGNIGRFISQDPVHRAIGDTSFSQEADRGLGLHLMNPQALNSYSYANNNPVTLSDPTGKIAPLVVFGIIWAAAELGLTAYDGYTAVRTVSDPNATAAEKSIAVGGFVAGLGLPGGGYGSAAKQVVNHADDVADGARLLNPGIKNIDSALDSHIIPRHTDSGIIRYSDKSKFDNGVDIGGLVQKSTQMPMTRSGSNFLRTYDAGKNIGTIGKDLENAGSKTSIITVVTDKLNNLISAYPGGPGKIK